MALEIRFKVKSLNKAVTNAGYVIMDSVRNQLQDGFTDIDIGGNVVIPIESKWVELGEGLRVTVDNYTGLNFDEHGYATDVVYATTAYVEYSATQDGIYVSCVTATLSDTDFWDMGDGTTINGDTFTYFYKSNGTFTITSGTFSMEVVISGAVPFDVSLDNNILTCTPQSGVFESWHFGDGETSEEAGVVTHELTTNGTFVVRNGTYQKIIELNYFTDGLVKSTNFNVVTLNGLMTSGVIDYGDGESGTELSHEYPHHGRFLVKSGTSKSYVFITNYVIPTASYITNLNGDDSSIVTFTGLGGDTYQQHINGEDFNERVVTYNFPESGYYGYVLNATLFNGNSNRITDSVKALVNNTLPVISIGVVADELEVQFTANVIDPDFESSHHYKWTFNKGQAYELFSYEKDPVKTYQNPVIPNDPNGQEFLVELQVTDNIGAVVTITKSITVYDF